MNSKIKNSAAEISITGVRMPVMFVGHGNPINAIEDNEFSRAWAEMGSLSPKPKAILCISAHWETAGTQVTAMPDPKTIHDFSGFPRELYEVHYNAPGSPELAGLVQELAGTDLIKADRDWGIDHGTWSVLCHMFPKADVPVVQFSLDRTKDAAIHYGLARGLKQLRHRGVLIIGSGNIVHNLRVIDWGGGAYDWAVEFDEKIKGLILANDHESVIEYQKLGKAARLSIPTNEHYLPLLYSLALQDPEDKISFFAEKVTLGSVSMRSVMIG
jgi:4,5-DOPA dioxygenase extradiol